jgi:caffeoyl-CoA O-methyltransferase
VLIVYNMFWGGNIFNAKDKTPATSSIRKPTEILTHSPDWITSLVPVRDGVIVADKE